MFEKLQFLLKALIGVFALFPVDDRMAQSQKLVSKCLVKHVSPINNKRDIRYYIVSRVV